MGGWEEQGLPHLSLSQNLPPGPSLLETIGHLHRSTWNSGAGGLDRSPPAVGGGQEASGSLPRGLSLQAPRSWPLWVAEEAQLWSSPTGGKRGVQWQKRSVDEDVLTEGAIPEDGAVGGWCGAGGERPSCRWNFETTLQGRMGEVFHT